MRHGNGDNPCPHCGYMFISLHTEHLRKCKRVPDKEILVDMLIKDSKLTLNKLALRYKLDKRYIVCRLDETEWEEKRLASFQAKEKKITNETKMLARKTKRDGMRRCSCGIIIPEGRTACKFCLLDKLGLKSYRDMGVRVWVKRGK